MKEKSKAFKVAMYIVFLIIYILLITFVDNYDKTIFVFMFISAVCNLALAIWDKEKSVLLIISSVLMIIYSILVFLGYNASGVAESHGDNQILMFIVAVAHIFAQKYVVIIIMWGVFPVICIYEIIKRKKNSYLKKKNGPIPKLNGVVKKDEKVYLHKVIKRNEYELIHMKGRKKRIVATFKVKSFLHEQYSMEWDGENKAVVRAYDWETHEMVMEKKIDIT